MPTFRVLRCANAQLYLAASILMLGAAAYVLCCKDALWQQITAVLAAICTPAWAAHFIALRFTVTGQGITRRSLWGTTSLRWADLTAASVSSTSNQGTASCTINLQAGPVSMRISSDLLPLDEVEELARELETCGMLR